MSAKEDANSKIVCSYDLNHPGITGIAQAYAAKVGRHLQPESTKLAESLSDVLRHFCVLVVLHGIVLILKELFDWVYKLLDHLALFTL